VLIEMTLVGDTPSLAASRLGFRLKLAGVKPRPKLVLWLIANQNPDGTQPSSQTPECKRPERKRHRAVCGKIMQKTHAMIGQT
jgi:hypothetical protein